MKKGFTLIELLAVIVILAIIALIATPIVLSIIEESKESATLRSAEMYLGGVETSVSTAILKNKVITDGTYNILENGNICLEYKDDKCSDELKVQMSGEVPKSGTIEVANGQIGDILLNLSNKTITKNEKGELVLGEAKEEKELAPGLYDENDNLLISWADLTSTEYQSFTLKWPNGTEEVSAILNVSEEGRLTSAVYTYDTHKNYSADHLNGKLVIPDNVTSIGWDAFYGCSGLTGVILPESITTIHSQAFSGCSSLKSIIIPKSVTDIDVETYVFSNCDNLEIIKVDKDNPVYDSRDNSNAIISTSTNTLLYGSKNTIIPSSVTSLAASSFVGMGLTNIVIPDNVTSIGWDAFSGNNLDNITIPSSVSRIEMYTFSYNKLTSVTIPDNVSYIDATAFEGCENLKTINYNGTATGFPWGAPNVSSN